MIKQFIDILECAFVVIQKYGILEDLSRLNLENVNNCELRFLSAGVTAGPIDDKNGFVPPSTRLDVSFYLAPIFCSNRTVGVVLSR